MKRRTISDIVAMESFRVPDSNFYKKIVRHQKRNWVIAQEGFLDIFKSKKQQSGQEKAESAEEHCQDLVNAEKVSIHLKSISVDEEIAYIEELISKVLPLLKNDIQRLENVFKFVINNHTTILDKLDKLVDVAWLGPEYPLSKDRHNIQFKHAIVAVYNLANDKKLQENITDDIMEWMNWESEFPDLDKDEIQKYAKLYSLQEAVPYLNFVVPARRATKDQAKIELEKNDHKLKKLLDAHIELIKKATEILSDSKMKSIVDLSFKADSATHPKDYGDGDETGMERMMTQGNGYLYQLQHGFKDDFIKNYTAH